MKLYVQMSYMCNAIVLYQAFSTGVVHAKLFTWSGLEENKPGLPEKTTFRQSVNKHICQLSDLSLWCFTSDAPATPTCLITAPHSPLNTGTRYNYRLNEIFRTFVILIAKSACFLPDSFRVLTNEYNCARWSTRKNPQVFQLASLPLVTWRHDDTLMLIRWGMDRVLISG